MDAFHYTYCNLKCPSRDSVSDLSVYDGNVDTVTEFGCHAPTSEPHKKKLSSDVMILKNLREALQLPGRTDKSHEITKSVNVLRASDLPKTLS
jgi:hypothetical protein